MPERHGLHAPAVESDKTTPPKQCHTAKRIYERPQVRANGGDATTASAKRSGWTINWPESGGSPGRKRVECISDRTQTSSYRQPALTGVTGQLLPEPHLRISRTGHHSGFLALSVNTFAYQAYAAVVLVM